MRHTVRIGTALVGAAITALVVGACQGDGPPVSSVTQQPTTPSSADSLHSAAPSGLPCNPQSSTCWVPDVGERFMGYKPAQHYSNAKALAAAAHCQTLSGSAFSPATPTAQAAECTLNGQPEGDGLTEAMIFRSSSAEATEAHKLARDAYTADTADYGVFGPGWMIGTISSVTDAPALQVQNTTGGVIVCFPGYSSNGGSC